MKRNSTTLFLESIGSITLVPWVNNAPDFTGFTDPTLSVLVNAYNDFIIDGGVIEIVPDPVVVVAPIVPNWLGFYDALIASQTYGYLIANTVPHPSISGVMAAMGVALIKGESDPSNPNRLEAFKAAVAGVLNAISAVNLSLTNEMIAEVRGILDANGFNDVILG